MNKFVHSSAVPSLVGRQVISAYIFNDEPDTHGIVLGLEDGSDLSIEVNDKTGVVAEILRCRSADEEAVILETAELLRP